MYRYETMARLARAKVVAIIREPSLNDGQRVAAVLGKVGFPALEVTCTTPGAFDIVQTALGTVLDPSEAVDAAHAGASYVVTPNFSADVIEAAHRHGLAALVGCATGTEIVQALTAGADAVKVFPAEQLGLGFLAAVHGPLPWAPLIPVGGVTVDNARNWLDHGAIAVGLGGGLTKGANADIAQRVERLLASLR